MGLFIERKRIADRVNTSELVRFLMIANEGSGMNEKDSLTKTVNAFAMRQDELRDTDRSINNQASHHIIDNEFVSMHDYVSRGLHLHVVLPEEVGQLVLEKKWGQSHPVVKLGYISGDNYLLHSARNLQEIGQLNILLRISYLFASGQW